MSTSDVAACYTLHTGTVMFIVYYKIPGNIHDVSRVAPRVRYSFGEVVQ